MTKAEREREFMTITYALEKILAKTEELCELNKDRITVSIETGGAGIHKGYGTDYDLTYDLGKPASYGAQTGNSEKAFSATQKTRTLAGEPAASLGDLVAAITSAVAAGCTIWFEVPQELADEEEMEAEEEQHHLTIYIRGTPIGGERC